MAVRKSAVHLTALVVVTLVGVGACEFRAQQGGAEGNPVANVVEETAVDTPSRMVSPTGAPAPPATAAPGPAGTGPTPRSIITTSPAPSRSPVLRAPSGACPQGEYQREVETYLAKLGGFGRITVDGRQSPADCLAIMNFQRRYGIQPAEGRAGPTTYDVSKRLASTDTRACRTGTGTTFCVNLTLQTVWAIRDGKVVMGPTVTRTGMPGYATPAGTYKVNLRNTREWSDPYHVWLPYWQRFIGGIGFHQTTTYLHNKSIGSHGCVNLLPVDARRLWDLGRVGTRVYVFGRRPGT